MNVLVLTPDRVGSSLLQKVITMTMLMYDYDKPVINLHELTNGIVKYHSNKYQQDVLGKPDKFSWGYHQKLEEVVNLLDSADHYKISRLAQYHILNRQDSLQDQLSFYEYLNKNFYLISARRENLFEHALSWCIVAFTKSLNVYTHEEKIEIFQQLYKKKITIDTEIFRTYLDKYVTYLKWVNDHFRINSIFHYEKDMNDLEGYVNKLDIFPSDQSLTSWQEGYGISWDRWNHCHYLISDTSGFSKSISNQSQLKQLAPPENKDLPLRSMNIEKLMTRNSLSTNHQNFLQENIDPYFNVYLKINQLVMDRTMIAGVPIKLQTLGEKAVLVKNFQECVDTYNDWSSKQNGNYQKFSLEDLGHLAFDEIKNWYNLK